MDGFINPFPSPPAWPNNARSSWNGAVATQPTNLLADSLETYGEGKMNPSSPGGSSNHVIGIATNDDFHVHDGASSIFIGSNLTYDNDKHQNHVEISYQDNSFTSQISSGIERCFHIHDGYNSTTESLESALPHSALAISDSMGSNITELPAFQQPLADSTLWPPSYAVAASLLGQGHLQDTRFHGVGSNEQGLMTTFENGKFSHGNILPTCIHPNGSNKLHDPHQSSFTLGQQINSKSGNLHPREEENGLHNLHPSSFPTGETVSSRMTGIQSSQQSVSLSNVIGRQLSTSQAQPLNPNPIGSNGTVKTRVRARRGQATDPHSIAERLRRERISERMKNLQELVPNSNKTDKASMLDEIIDYVKFLQLQVKVLSMSRLGATGAVVPLLTDTQAERSGSLPSASSLGQGGADLSESKDNLAFEQEVVKLMETNVTSAMQYLQNKGLCLMPTALASAISNQKGSSVAVSSGWRKVGGSRATISQGSSQECPERRCADGPNCYNGDVLKKEAAQEPSEN